MRNLVAGSRSRLPGSRARKWAARTAPAVALLITTALAGRATAAPITSAADPALQGAFIVDFESTPPGTYADFAGGLSVPTAAGVVAFSAPRLQITSTYAGLYNMTGRYLSSEGYLFRNVIITFPVPVRAFGFNVGLTSQPWELHAYDGAGNEIEMTSIAPTFGSNAGDFVGITSATDIAQAVFVVQLPLRPGPLWAVIDNLAFRTTAAELSVRLLGHGVGTVGSTPAGIDCGATCSASYSAGSAVTLDASPATGSFFGGWGDACAGSAAASTVVVAGTTACTATFHLLAESADLRVDAVPATARPRAGRAVKYRLTAKNAGPASAPATVLTVTLDGLAAADVATIGAPKACTVDGATVTCPLGNLARDSQRTIIVGATPSGPGTLTLRAAATSDAPDPTPADAAATLTSSVR